MTVGSESRDETVSEVMAVSEDKWGLGLWV